MTTPYRIVAKAAFMKWFNYSEKEATKKIELESIQELENQVYAMDSIKYAVIGIAKEVGLNEKETTKFFTSIVYGGEDDTIFTIVKSRAVGFTEEQKLNVLSIIHDGWVVNNSSEKVFNKKVSKSQLRQYTPLELIGWNEVTSDLLFLRPVIESIGVELDEEKLSQAYHVRVKNYMDEKQINDIESLTSLVRQGREYYPILPKELEKRLKPMCELISTQLIENWSNNDKETIKIYESRQQSKSI